MIKGMQYRKVIRRIPTILAACLVLACAPSPELKSLSRPHAGERIALGRDLFFDVRLSADETISCASCHDPSQGGDDGQVTAIGIGGVIGPINTPTILNAGLNFAQFWDGRSPSLVDQVRQPILNPLEMGDSWDPVLDRLTQDPRTVERFRSVYSGGPTPANIADAIATYERALLTLNSPFDRYQCGEKEAISPAAAKGFAEFQRLGCASCHQGLALGGNMYERIGVMGDYFAWRGTPVSKADLGRYNVTGREEDKYKFKVPGLRNIALTQPYFHDGSAATLGEAVHIMAEQQIGLPVDDVQTSQLVAFLQSLTGTVDPELQ